MYCTQLRTSSFCSSEKKKKILSNLFLCVWNLLPRGFIGLLQVALHIMMSLKSLVSSFPPPIHFPCSNALPPSHCHSLSRCFYHPALRRSQSLQIKEIKHRYSILACKLPWCKGKTISLLYFINHISLRLLLARFSEGTWKNAVVCNDLLLTSCFSSFSASPFHSPASPLNFLLFWRSLTKEKTTWSLFPFQQLRYTTRRPQKKILHQSLKSLVSSFPRPLHCSSSALPLSPCLSPFLCSSYPVLLSALLLTR